MNVYAPDLKAPARPEPQPSQPAPAHSEPLKPTPPAVAWPPSAAAIGAPPQARPLQVIPSQALPPHAPPSHPHPAHPPPPAAVYHPSHPQPRPSPYMYALHHQVLTPVAHVPIGAAHYAHLPPSIWAAPHAPYHTPAPRAVHLHHTHAHAPIYAAPPPIHAAHTLPSAHHLAFPTFAAPPIPPPAPLKLPTLPATQQPSAQIAYHVPAPALPPQPTLTIEHAPQVPQEPQVETPPQAPAASAVKQNQNAQGQQDELDCPATVKQPAQEAAGTKQPPATQRQRAPPTGGQPPRKPRKPYTITKSREVWTPEEHSRFVHALQLYDRDWKKIETYIGTKTVLQIRSHAQKHFGKVTKYKTGEYIPPPRPKKRATLPYPRSRSAAATKVVTTPSTGTNSDSGAGSENGTLSGSCSGSAGAGNITTSPDMLPNLRPCPELGNCTANGNSPKPTRVANRTQAHQQRRSTGGISTTENGSYESHNPYYNLPSSGIAYPHREAEKGQQPTPTECALPSMAQHLPPWNTKSVPPASAAVENHPPHDPDRRYNPHPPAAFQSQYQRMAVDLRKGNSQLSQPRAAYSHVQNDRGVNMRHNDRLGNMSSPSIQDGSATANGLSDHSRMGHSSLEDIRQGIPNHGEVRAAIHGPSNSLHVLSNCVDMMARESPPDRQPAVGWASAAAARRAHRARVIRARKPPLPSNLSQSQGESVAGNCARNTGNEGAYRRERPSSVHGLISPQNSDKTVQGQPLTVSAPQRVHSQTVDAQRSGSPPTVPQDEANRSAQDPRRSSAGSENQSDDAIAGFSCSDRPSGSDMAGGLSSQGSGSGGSLENSDAGEEEPKSSNDGSGDDVNRQLSSTRDSSPADPASSGSRENSPNTPNLIPDQSNGSFSRPPGGAGDGNLVVLKAKATEANATGNDKAVAAKQIDGETMHGVVGQGREVAMQQYPISSEEAKRRLSSPSKTAARSQGPHSIRSLCSDGPPGADTYDLISMKEKARKRPRSPFPNGGVQDGNVDSSIGAGCEEGRRRKSQRQIGPGNREVANSNGIKRPPQPVAPR